MLDNDLAISPCRPMMVGGLADCLVSIEALAALEQTVFTAGGAALFHKTASPAVLVPLPKTLLVS